MIKLEYGDKSEIKQLELKYWKVIEKEIFYANGRKNIEKYFSHLKTIDRGFALVFNNVEVRDIIFKKPNEIFDFITLTEDKILNLSDSDKITKFRDKCTKIFNYKDKFQTLISEFFRKNIHVSTCCYCNKAYIDNFKNEQGAIKSVFELDHFYDKATFPYLAISFYNLIPSCPTCNSSNVKGSQNFFRDNIKILNHSNYDFHEKVKFHTNLQNFPISKPEDIEIKIDPSGTEYIEYVKNMYLEERYQFHKDVVLDMHDKHQRYPETKISDMATTLGITPIQIKKDIFGKLIFETNPDLSSELISKLRIDIAKQLLINV